MIVVLLRIGLTLGFVRTLGEDTTSFLEEDLTTPLLPESTVLCLSDLVAVRDESSRLVLLSKPVLTSEVTALSLDLVTLVLSESVVLRCLSDIVLDRCESSRVVLLSLPVLTPEPATLSSDFVILPLSELKVEVAALDLSVLKSEVPLSVLLLTGSIILVLPVVLLVTLTLGEVTEVLSVTLV